MLQRDDAEFAAIRGTFNRLRFIVYHHLAAIRREPALSRIVLQELRPDPDYRRTPVFQLNQSYTQRLVDLVRQAVASGEFRDDVSPALVRDMVYGCIEHRTWSFLRNEGDFDIDATADGIAEMIYRGLAADPSGESARIADAVDRLEAVAARLEDAAGQRRRA